MKGGRGAPIDTVAILSYSLYANHCIRFSLALNIGDCLKVTHNGTGIYVVVAFSVPSVLVKDRKLI
jgi:hypothetical protein